MRSIVIWYDIIDIVHYIMLLPIHVGGSSMLPVCLKIVWWSLYSPTFSIVISVSILFRLVLILLGLSCCSFVCNIDYFIVVLYLWSCIIPTYQSSHYFVSLFMSECYLDFLPLPVASNYTNPVIYMYIYLKCIAILWVYMCNTQYMCLALHTACTYICLGLLCSLYARGIVCCTCACSCVYL